MRTQHHQDQSRLVGCGVALVLIGALTFWAIALFIIAHFVAKAW